MYQNIFYDRKTSMVHLWDDKEGYTKFKHKPYAFRRKQGGNFRSIFGDELERITDYHPKAQGLYSSDVPVDTQVLIDAYGDSDDVSTNHRLAVIDIEVNTVGGYPNMTTFNQPITAVAVYSSVKKHYYCLVLDEKGEIEDYEEEGTTVKAYRTEESLILAFLDLWEDIAPTIATGWNTDGFDFPYLFGRIEKVIDEKTACRLSPIGIAYWNKYKGKMTIAGVNCLDYIVLYRDRYSGKKLPNYRLDSVAMEELKIGKVKYEGSLDDLKRTDIKKFVEYNIRDIHLIVKLDDKLKFIDLAMSICHVCHVGYEEFHTSSKFLEGAMLTYLYREKLVAPNKKFEVEEEYSVGGDDDDDEDDVGFTGAYVKQPSPARYEWVCSSDINSLYPSVIMTLNVSPETKICKIDKWDTDTFVKGTLEDIEFDGEKYTSDAFRKILEENNLSISANGVIYDQNRKGCIPEILKKWFSERVEFKNKMKECSDKKDKEGTEFWKRRQLVQKILLNSLYGVVGMEGWRFYDKDNAEAITLTGQSIIKTSEKYVNNQLNKRCGTKDMDYIIAIDTDSLYIHFAPLVKAENVTDPKAFCIKEIANVSASLNKLYDVLVKRMYNSILNRIVIASDVVTSASIWTGKKRYAMLKVYDMELKKDIDELKVVGIDVVRSSFPKKFREFMSEVLMDILRSTTKKELDIKILAFKAKIKDFDLQDVAKNTSVKFVSEKTKINFDPKGRAPFTFIKGATAQCKATLAYNDMLKHYKLTDVEPCMSGGKVKWAYLKDNPFQLDGLAFKDDGKDPKEVLDYLAKYSDRNKIWDKELQKKLVAFYNAMKWDIFNENQAAIDEFFTF